MKTIYYWNDKRIKKKDALDMFGSDTVKRITEEAWNMFCRDPNRIFSQFIYDGNLRVEFKV